MTRYIQQYIITRYDGKRVFKTIQYPVIPVTDNDIYYIASEADRLDTIAFKFYKDVTYWWIIARANNLGHGSIGIPEGCQLRIPANPDSIISTFRSLNA